MLRQAVGTEIENATPHVGGRLRQLSMVGGAGFEPKPVVSSGVTETTQNCANLIQDNALPDSASSALEQKPTLSQHTEDVSPHVKCATCVQENQPVLPEDLSLVVAAWDRLPAAVKAGILAMVAASEPGQTLTP